MSARARLAERALAIGGAAALVLAVAWTFAPALSGDFLAWDDDPLLLREDRWRGPLPEALRFWVTTRHMGHWQPLTWASYRLDLALFGLEPAAFHRTNLVLHAISAVLLLLLARNWIDRSVRGGSEILRSAAALWVAACFALHPLRVESVAWITERRDVLSTALLFAALLAHDRFVRAQERGENATARLALFGMHALTVLSACAKAWAMVMPILLLVLDAIPYRRWKGVGGTASARVLLREKLGILGIAAATAALAASAQSAQELGLVGLPEHSLSARVAQASFGLCHYLERTVWPGCLSPLVEIPADLGLRTPRFLIRMLCVLGAGVAAFALRRRVPGLLAAGIAYAALLAPVLGFAQSGPQLVADRYSHLATVPFVLAAAVFVVRFLAKPARLRASFASVVAVLAVTILVALAHAAHRQCGAWRTTSSLWQAALACDPDNSIALYDLGTHLAATDSAEALPYLERAVAAAPERGDAWFNLGVCEDRLGRTDRAEAAYRRALPTMHGPDPARRRLADLAAERGALEEALAFLREVPDDSASAIPARLREAELLRSAGRFPEAVAVYRRLLAAHPRLDEANTGLREAAAGR